jgi:hypothetical protein
MLSHELDCQLRLAYSTKPVKNKDLLSAALLSEKDLFELSHLGRSLHKLAHSRDTFEAEGRSIFSKICINDLALPICYK